MGYERAMLRTNKIAVRSLISLMVDIRMAGVDEREAGGRHGSRAGHNAGPELPEGHHGPLHQAHNPGTVPVRALPLPVCSHKQYNDRPNQRENNIIFEKNHSFVRLSVVS